MKIEEFNKIVESVMSEKPILFGLEADDKPTNEKLEWMERYYDIKLPKTYKDFLLRFGGGYFAYIIVYSLDENSNFYLKDRVHVEYMKKNSFLPVIDFETGDVAGFRIIDGICQDMISVYNHENGEIEDMGLDLYSVLIEYGLGIV